MSAKRMIFSQGQQSDRDDHAGSVFGEGESLYTGHPDLGQAGNEQQQDAPQGGNSARGAAKGRAAFAYAAQEEIPPASQGAGFGSIGGLFPDDSAGSAGCGPQPWNGGGELLDSVAEEVLAAECQKRICPTCPVKKETEESRLRALADLDNAKKRLAREREEQTRFAAESVLSDIIPSLDNLDLALKHAANNEACKDFVLGVSMTRKLLTETLVKHGLVRIGEVGEEFNPALYEAVAMIDSPTIPDGHICELLSNGYILHSRLLRPARVVVCKKS